MSEHDAASGQGSVGTPGTSGQQGQAGSQAQQSGVSAEAQTEWKAAAARAAAASVPDGAVIGLGSGSTAALMLQALAERVREGLHVTGVPTSDQTQAEAQALGIPIAQLDDVQILTCSIDGADEVTLPQLNLIKGRGGALLREKMVAAASRFRIIIVDVTKIVPVLASTHPVPVEVAQFGWRHTAGRLVALGARPALRPAAGTSPNDAPTNPYVTDGGNYILDCAFGPIYQPEPLAAAIKAVVGVVDSGLFVAMTDRVYVSGPQGVQVYNRA